MKRSWRELAQAQKRSMLGTWAQIAAPEMVDLIGGAGFDFAIIDCEHGFFGIETAENLIRACDANDLVPLVRVLPGDLLAIGKALDAGAAGVVVPGIDGVEAARRAISAAKFGPDGTRGACPCVRAGGHFVRNWRPYRQRAESETAVLLLIESRNGLAEIEQIVRLPGLGGIVIGPFDLSVAMGHDGDYLHEEVQTAVEHMVSVSLAAGVSAMMPVFAPALEVAREQVQRWEKRGVQMFAIGSDKILVADHFARYVSGLK